MVIEISETLTREQALQIVPDGCKVNWHNKTLRWYAYTATNFYDPVAKRSKEKRVTIGHIDESGQFVYSKHYLMTQKLHELQTGDGSHSQNTIEILSSQADKLVNDPRKNPNRCIYKLHHVLIISILASLSGLTSAVGIADYWRTHHEYLKSILPDLPQQNISHDTVRRLLCLLEPTEILKVLKSALDDFYQKLPQAVISMDGQMIKATRNSAQDCDGRYVLNFYDTDCGLALFQELVGEKKSEVSHAKAIVKSLDLAGCIVTADALHTKTAFVKELCRAKADYCLAVKKNNKTLYNEMADGFEFSKTITQTLEATVEKGHGRLETRQIYLLPTTILSESTRKQWQGLEEGTLVKCVAERTQMSTGETSTDIRYFICSLDFNHRYIGEQIKRAVRRHWAVENELHYVLDVDFQQDKTQCKNMNYLQNRTTLNKIGFNYISQLRTLQEEETGKSSDSVKRMMIGLNTPKTALEAITKILSQARLQNS